MANNTCLFPNSKEAEALAYKAACDAHYSANFEPGGVAVNCRLDKHGNWAVAHYAPPFDPDGTGAFVEPPECEGLRQDAAIVSMPEWPEEEE